MLKTENKPKQVKCPQCGCLTLYTPENAHRPFCSQRCRTMDLAAWADETYKIPVLTPVVDSSGSEFELDEFYDQEN